LVTDCLSAKIPTILSPLFPKATTEGTRIEPSRDSKHSGSPCKMVAILEIDVPKSIPNIFDILKYNANHEKLFLNSHYFTFILIFFFSTFLGFALGMINFKTPPSYSATAFSPITSLGKGTCLLKYLAPISFR